MNMQLLANFFSAKQNDIELYNEAGLQYELALHLTKELQEYQIRLEYPISRVYQPNSGFVKKEMDIYLTSSSGEKFLIELKLPKQNCAAPQAMYEALKDVKFSEQLKEKGFKNCYSLLITERPSFWAALRANEAIYKLFNGTEVNFESIDSFFLPKFLHKKGSIHLNKTYQVKWNEFRDAHNHFWKYYILEM